MMNYNVYLYDGYKGFYKLFTATADILDTVIKELQEHFIEETNLFGLDCTNGRHYQIKVGRKVIADFFLRYDRNNGYNFDV